MPFPTSITFRDMDSSPALEQLVRESADKLEQFHHRIERCEVVIDRPHQHHRQGQHIRVRITVAVPGPDVVVSRDPGRDGAHEDAQVAVRDAFKAVRRQLEDRSRKMRREVKAHVGPAHARVTFIDVEGDWGYLESDGRQIYFHRNAVLGGVKLEVGDEVRFAEELGDKGPQATSVAPIGANGHHDVTS